MLTNIHCRILIRTTLGSQYVYARRFHTPKCHNIRVLSACLEEWIFIVAFPQKKRSERAKLNPPAGGPADSPWLAGAAHNTQLAAKTSGKGPVPTTRFGLVDLCGKADCPPRISEIHDEAHFAFPPQRTLVFYTSYRVCFRASACRTRVISQ